MDGPSATFNTAPLAIPDFVVTLRTVMSSRFDKAAFGTPPVTAPAYVHAAPRAGIEAALAAIADAKSEEEALAAAQRFAEVAAAAFTPGSDPLAFIAALFDAETAEVVADTGSAAVADLEAEAAATGGEITEQATERVVRKTVKRITQRSPRTMAFVPHALRASRARRPRAPRARRGPRRSVRLSAVASAGDGPPRPSSDPEPCAPEPVSGPRARPVLSRATALACASRSSADATIDDRRARRARGVEACVQRAALHVEIAAPCVDLRAAEFRDARPMRRRHIEAPARGSTRTLPRAGAVEVPCTRRPRTAVRSPRTSRAGAARACRRPSHARREGAGGG
jgi:hypothetical protein